MPDPHWLNRDGNDPHAIAMLGAWCGAVFAVVIFVEVIRACFSGATG